MTSSLRGHLRGGVGPSSTGFSPPSLSPTFSRRHLVPAKAGLDKKRVGLAGPAGQPREAALSLFPPFPRPSCHCQSGQTGAASNRPSQAHALPLATEGPSLPFRRRAAACLALQSRLIHSLRQRQRRDFGESRLEWNATAAPPTPERCPWRAHTGMRIMVCVRLGEFSSCSCLSLEAWHCLGKWVLLNKIHKPFFSILYKREERREEMPLGFPLFVGRGRTNEENSAERRRVEAFAMWEDSLAQI